MVKNKQTEEKAQKSSPWTWHPLDSTSVLFRKIRVLKTEGWEQGGKESAANFSFQISKTWHLISKLEYIIKSQVHILQYYTENVLEQHTWLHSCMIAIRCVTDMSVVLSVWRLFLQVLLLYYNLQYASCVGTTTVKVFFNFWVREHRSKKLCGMVCDHKCSGVLQGSIQT